MKKIIYLFTIIIGLSIVSCGGEESTPDVEKVEEVKLKGFEELDLSEWGFDLTVMVPKEEMNGEAKVTLMESGVLNIVVGLNFGIEIAYGEADLALLKSDLKEDLVFTSEILQEEENAIIYSQDIPDSGVKSRCHFLYKAVVGSDAYEVKDVFGGQYGKGMIEKMLKAAKTIKSSKIEKAV